MLATAGLILSACVIFSHGTTTQTNITGQPWNIEEPRNTVRDLPLNCLDLQQDGMTANGIYTIYPYTDHPNTPVLVLCDQETDGGGWTVIQNRYDGSENFYRSWVEYSEGFGNLEEEHYLGNDLISVLTDQAVNEMRVDMEGLDGVTAYAHYQAFDVNAEHYYQLSIFNYNGTAGDALIYDHNGQYFSTFDEDHDSYNSGNCAEEYNGAWWYNECADSDLNGLYEGGFYWDTFAFLKKSKMMIRPYSRVAACTGGLHYIQDRAAHLQR
ncbi:unnamed protein product [Meganyctiphanes norvegica]|uniref:Fibrinogen C-terminal domain-containing protein n=1 Tax=Meganyctiphanes norvegica TaxID=48144 RepID=A0AAV2S642_MEGNR